jgi:hypothetical protein
MTDSKRTVGGMWDDKLRTIVTRPYAWWVQCWWTDLLLAAALTVILHETAHAGTGVDVLGALKLADRQAVYTDALQLTAVFGGFSAVAFTVYLGLNSRTVRRIKVNSGKPLLNVWIASLVTPWLCAVVMVCCVATDRGDSGSGNLTRWVAFAALTVVLLEMIRLIWIFYHLAVAELGESTPTKTVSDEELHVVKQAARH